MKKLIRAGVVGLALYGAYSLYKMYDMKKSIRNIIDDWDDEMGYPEFNSEEHDSKEDNFNKDQVDDWDLDTERDKNLFNVEPDYSGEFKTEFNGFEKSSDNVFDGSIFVNTGVEDDFGSEPDLDDDWALEPDPDDDTTKSDSEQYPEDWDSEPNLDDETDKDNHIKEDLSFESNDDYIEDEEEF